MNQNKTPEPEQREVYILRYWRDPDLHGQIVQVSSGAIYPIYNPEALLAIIRKQMETTHSANQSSGLK